MTWAIQVRDSGADGDVQFGVDEAHKLHVELCTNYGSYVLRLSEADELRASWHRSTGKSAFRILPLDIFEVVLEPILNGDSKGDFIEFSEIRVSQNNGSKRIFRSNEDSLFFDVRHADGFFRGALRPDGNLTIKWVSDHDDRLAIEFVNRNVINIVAENG